MPTATPSSSDYVGYCPVGAFIADGKRLLGPLVAEMRRRGRLRSGRNVTPFHTSAVDFEACRRECACEDGGAGGDGEEKRRKRSPQPSLATFWLDVLESKEGPTCVSRHRVVVAVDRRGPAEEKANHSAHERRAQLFSESSSSGLLAVHVTGTWSESELAALLLPATDQVPFAIAYVHQLRVFSAACVSSDSSEGVAGTPSARAFHALRALTTAQGRQRHGGEEDHAKDGGEGGGGRAGAFTFSELFGGIGMFRVGLERAGGSPCFAVECALPARTTYEANFAPSPSAPLVADITEVPSVWFPPHDLLTAGFPCQSFAKAGSVEGLHAAKGSLFYEVVRVLLATRPKAFLLENVANLTNVENGAQLREVLTSLRHPGRTGVAAMEDGGGGGGGGSHTLAYNVGYRVIDGAVVTPQTRLRVYFVGLRLDPHEGASPTATKHGDAAFVEELFDAAEARLAAMARHQPLRSVADVLEPQVSGSALALTETQWEAVRRSHTFRQNPSWRLVNVLGKARTLLGSYRTSYQLYSEFLPFPDERLALSFEAFAECVREAALALRRGSFEEGAEEGEGDSSPPSPLLRFFSLRECARLQGIPDTYQFPVASESTSPTKRPSSSSSPPPPPLLPPGAVYKLIGNAVNPLVIECLGRSIAERVFCFDTV